VWLTYRYRFGAGTASDATGTIKAPSFGAAARRLVAERLGDRLGPAPAYLRLRAAGETEAWFVVSREPPAGVGRSTLTRLPARPDDWPADGTIGLPDGS
jgi:hypothetical protein